MVPVNIFILEKLKSNYLMLLTLLNVTSINTKNTTNKISKGPSVWGVLTVKLMMLKGQGLSSAQNPP